MCRSWLGRHVRKLGSIVGHFDAGVGAAHPSIQVRQTAKALQSRLSICNLRWVRFKKCYWTSLSLVELK